MRTRFIVRRAWACAFLLPASSVSALVGDFRRFRARGGSRFDETLHCATPDLWEVTLTHYGEQKGPAGFPDHLFLVRWRPPYHFTMVDVSTTPWPRCTEKDPDADAWRTLFATQDWR